MGQSRVPVKGVGYLEAAKRFFQVAVGGKLSVECWPIQTQNKGGTIPARPDNPNKCSHCLGYLPKKKRALPALNFMRCPMTARLSYFANVQIRYHLSLPKC